MTHGVMNRVCDECGKPQFPSPSGWVCENGHGDAPWHLEEVKGYRRQYIAWFNRTRAEIRKAHKE